MKKLLAGLLSGGLLVSPAWADTQRGFYAGLGIAVVSGDDGSAFEDASMPTVELIGGYKYNALLGLEVRGGAGLKKDRDVGSDYFRDAVEENADITQIDRELITHTAIYYRPELVNEKSRLYGLLGYARLSTRATELGGVDAEDTLIVHNETLTGLSYGAGVGFFIDEQLSVNFEYRKLLHEDDYRFETLSVHLDYRF